MSQGDQTAQQNFLLQQGVLPYGVDPSSAIPQGEMSSPEQQKALAQLQAAQLQSFQDQRQGIADLENYTQGVGSQEIQTNLSPLMGLVDERTGSKLAQSYTAPESGQERIASVARLKQAVNKAKGELTADEIALLKAKLQAMTTQSIFGQKMGTRAEDKALKATQEDLDARDKMIKTEEAKKIGGIINFNNALTNYVTTAEKYGDLESLTGDARSEIESAYAKVQTEFAKAAGLGALSGPDLGILLDAVKPQTGIAGGINQIMAGGRSGLKKGVANLIEKSKSEYDNYTSTLGAAYAGRDVTPVLNNWDKKYKASIANAPKMEVANKGFKPGTIVNGKRFKGGNPKDQANWEMVK